MLVFVTNNENYLVDGSWCKWNAVCRFLTLVEGRLFVYLECDIRGISSHFQMLCTQRIPGRMAGLI